MKTQRFGLKVALPRIHKKNNQICLYVCMYSTCVIYVYVTFKNSYVRLFFLIRPRQIVYY